MSKAHVVATLMIIVSLTGCIEDDSDDEPTLRESLDGLIGAINANDAKKYCSYILEYEGTFLTGDEKEECEDDWEDEDDEGKYKTTISNYNAEKQDYKASESSGYVYIVSISYEDCWRENSTESWECDTYDDFTMDWVKVDGRWGWGPEGLDEYYESDGSAPIATFFVQESSGGVYHVDVIKVSKQEDLAGFSYYLKDESGSTYVGGNGFGEIAMQIIGGEKHGIEASYNGNDEQLQSRATNVSEDDGSDFPVHFYDNDSDGKLSAGDQFEVYGYGNAANGPAEENWRLDIQFDASGDIIGSAKML